MYLRVGSPQGISRTKWLECTCGLAACRAFQGPNGLNVPAGWQPAGHFKNQISNGLNVPAGWQPAGHFKDQPAGWQPAGHFKDQNGLNVPAGWQPAGHFKDQMA